jgi:ribokinase
LRSKITVIGSSNVDLVVRVPTLPLPGQTVSDGRFVEVFGGKGANQAVAAARAGGRVEFVTAVGRDDVGRRMMDHFRAQGLGLSKALIVDDAPSGTALIMCDDHGENCIAVAPGANDRLTPRHVDLAADLIGESAMVLMQMELPADTTSRALELASRAGVPVVFNYAPVRSMGVSVTKAMHVLVVNESEAGSLLGASKPQTPAEAIAACLRLRAMGPESVLVTLGPAGVCGVDGSGEFHVPARAVRAIDSTAAGDTFCGALAVAMIEGQPIREAVGFAQKAAAISVTRVGAQTSIPTRTEIDAFVHEMR